MATNAARPMCGAAPALMQANASAAAASSFNNGQEALIRKQVQVANLLGAPTHSYRTVAPPELPSARLLAVILLGTKSTNQSTAPGPNPGRLRIGLLWRRQPAGQLGGNSRGRPGAAKSARSYARIAGGGRPFRRSALSGFFLQGSFAGYSRSRSACSGWGR